MFEWQIEYQPVENHLLLKSKGTMDVQSANVMVKELAEAAEKHQCVKHLIDHRETTFAFSFVDYYERPAVNARLGISRLFITAMVISKITEDTKFMETVFRNRGFSMYHFIDMDQAREWLKQR